MLSLSESSLGSPSFTGHISEVEIHSFPVAHISQCIVAQESNRMIYTQNSQTINKHIILKF